MNPYEKFCSFVDDSAGPDACHIWTGHRDRDGYGRFRRMPAARWLLEHLRDAPLTRQELALHHCDNPPCVNPAHLYVGDHEQNMRDMVRRGRSRSPNAAKTHCAQGHEYSPENTYRWGTKRFCRACNRRLQERRKQQLTAARSRQ